MNPGDMVRARGYSGIIIECLEDDFWGETAKILFFDGTFSEWEKDVLEFLYPLESGGYGISLAKSHYGLKGFYHSGKVER